MFKLFANIVHRLIGIDDAESCRAGMRPFQIGQAHPFVKIGPLLLESVQTAVGQDDAFACHVEWQVEQQGQVGLQVGVHPVFKGKEFGAIQTAPPTLDRKSVV